MRKVAILSSDMVRKIGITRLMMVIPSKLCRDECVVYGYRFMYDCSAFTVWGHESESNAYDYCASNLGVEAGHWNDIPDQIAECREDWMGHIRVARGNGGELLFGMWEQYTESGWINYESENGEVGGLFA